MDRKVHGRALIINNLASDPSEPISSGAKCDVKNLKKLFTNLNYDVEMKVGLDKGKMMALFDKIAAYDHSKYDSFVCCILSHGGDYGKLYGTTGEPLVLDDLVDSL